MAKPIKLPPSGGLGRGFPLVGPGLPFGWGGASLSLYFTTFTVFVPFFTMSRPVAGTSSRRYSAAGAV